MGSIDELPPGYTTEDVLRLQLRNTVEASRRFQEETRLYRTAAEHAQAVAARALADRDRQVHEARWEAEDARRTAAHWETVARGDQRKGAARLDKIILLEHGRLQFLTVWAAAAKAYGDGRSTRRTRASAAARVVEALAALRDA